MNVSTTLRKIVVVGRAVCARRADPPWIRIGLLIVSFDGKICRCLGPLDGSENKEKIQHDRYGTAVTIAEKRGTCHRPALVLKVLC